MDYITERYFELLKGTLYVIRHGAYADNERLARHVEALLENMKLHLESILRNTDD